METRQATALEIREAQEKEEFLMCWDVVRVLRPHLTEDRYLTLMLYMLDEGYRLLYIVENGRAVSVCGYRFSTMLQRGRSIYIDDLATLPEARRRGYATTLLQRVIQEARDEEMQGVHLNAGFQRHEAHRLFMKLGFRLEGQHFAMEVG